jgi:hypothetical protein
MNKYISTTVTYVGVWFIASILNGLLSSICMLFLTNDTAGMNGVPGLSFLFSFILSVPFVGMVWFVNMIALSCGQKEFSLFQVILKATLLCSVLAAILFVNTLGKEFKEARYAMGLCIIVSAMGSTLFFRNQLKTNG